MNKWQINVADEKAVKDITLKSDLKTLCAEVLASRGVKNVKQAAEFFANDDFRSPFEIRDMQKAVDVITASVDAGEKICIYGDYDCDGVTATAMLYSYLYEMGADVTYYIPEREEGYGMNPGSVAKMHDMGTQLVITVDNGITALGEAKLINELGMKLVVTDHHQPLDELPQAEAVVDAHRTDDTSFFKYFCGAGIVFKLIAAMEEGDYALATEHFSELAAIATVGDIVSLTGENRKLVRIGMAYLENTERPGLIALRKNAGYDKRKINSSALAYGYIPRINASGRTGSPQYALKLLLAETKEEAEKYMTLMDECNKKRKNEEERILKGMYAEIAKHPALIRRHVLVLAGMNWHPGVIGITAARMEEKYGKPCYVITGLEGGEFRGSARAFGEFSIFESLKYCSDLLEKFGGHQGAGGFSLKKENIGKFAAKLEEFARVTYEKMPRFTYNIDMLLTPEDATVENIEGLEALEPFGEGNPEPLFLLKNAVVTGIYPMSEGKHTKINLKYGDKFFSAPMFKVKPNETGLVKGKNYDFVVRTEINEYNGNRSVQFFIVDSRISGIDENRYFASYDAYEKLINNEDMPLSYYIALCPNKNDFLNIYRSLPQEPEKKESVYYSLNLNISYGKFLTAIDIFSETGACVSDYVSETVKIVPNVTLKPVNSSLFVKLLGQIKKHRERSR